MLAHFRGDAPSEIPSAAALPRGVVYVGESKHLNVRPVGDHPRRLRYCEVFADEDCAMLWVCVAPFYTAQCPQYAIHRVFSDYMEMQLAWEYARQHCYPLALHFKPGSQSEADIRKAADSVKNAASDDSNKEPCNAGFGAGPCTCGR